ncbi:N-acetyltransferase [Photobacterium sanctipauli]|uniref:N-acetyltransferase n=1 Tax=Photobacterium sanctipauli TaxID=1342794 RepID=A0A2T3P0S9_9GAMM|nr:GNAT family protein [Photobacterium sanctipauli]PSW22079.1 N-acetyltransferase [Photobacterium sanctipauli]
MLSDKEIILRKARNTELESLYALVTDDEAWTAFNGPYFPYQTPTLDEFAAGQFKRLCEGDTALLIEYENRPVGMVSYYWECESTRWLEVGIVIYDSTCWGQSIGRKALAPWVSHLFKSLEIERVGLTTWSGNPRMMACAERLGMIQEARLRKVRYYQGEYYDSVRYGVLRSEWFAMLEDN